MKFLNTFASACIAASAAFFSLAAGAQVTYSLNSTAVAGFGSGPYGTVTLTQSFSNVLVQVDLRTGLNFVDTGSHSIFTFNLGGTSSVSDISGITFANGLGDAFVVTGNEKNSPFSLFTYGIGCLDTRANRCVNGGSGGGYVDPLNFTVKNKLISDFAFKSTGNGTPAYFSADVINGVGDTGTVGATPVSAVPEPETYAMMLAGLGLMGTIVRRRKNKAA